MLGLAIASYQYIEKPLRKGNWFGKRWKTIIAGGGLIVTLSGFVITLGKPLKGQLYTGKRIQTSKTKTMQGEKCIEYISTNIKCFLFDNKSQQTLYLLGDSHAQFQALAGEKVASYWYEFEIIFSRSNSISNSK